MDWMTPVLLTLFALWFALVTYDAGARFKRGLPADAAFQSKFIFWRAYAAWCVILFAMGCAAYAVWTPLWLGVAATVGSFVWGYLKGR